MDLLSKGITIVTLEPEERFNTSSINDTVKLIVVIVILSRAYEESATKSARLTAAWENKRTKLEKGIKITARIPGWLEKQDNTFVFNNHASTIKRIIKMYLDGHGTTSIARELNAEKIPTLGRGKQKANFWRQSSIIKILNSRALIGEYQPHLGKSNQDQSKRQSIGEPITDYYPAIIKESDFYKIKRKIEDKRTSIKGRVGNGNGNISNLFRGVITDVRDDSSLIIVNKGSRGSGKQLVSSRAKSDNTIDYVAFPYAPFEESILKLMSKITASDILPQGSEDHSEELESATLKLAKIDEKILKLQNKIENADDPDEIDPFLPMVSKLTKQKRETQNLIDDIQQKLHSSLPTSDDCRSLVELIQNGDDVDDNRRRFRSVFLNLVKRVEALVLKSGHWRQAFIRLTFENGNRRMIVCNCHRAKYISSGGFDGDYPIDHKKTQKHLQKRLDELKARSVMQTTINLENQLFGAAALQTGIIRLTDDTVSHEKWENTSD